MNGLVGARRIRGDRDDASIEAAKKSGDKLQARRIEEEDTIAGGGVVAQFHREGTSSAVETGIGERGSNFVAGLQKAERDPLTEGIGAGAQHIRPSFADR